MFAVGLAFMFGAYITFTNQPKVVEGAGFIGLAGTQMTATTTAVGPQETITIFSSKKYCTSRIISTTDGTGSAIRVLFGDPTNGDVASTSISAVVGHIQAASTTQAYDSGVYGCGRWTAYAEATTTLMIAEFN